MEFYYFNKALEFLSNNLTENTRVVKKTTCMSCFCEVIDFAAIEIANALTLLMKDAFM